MKTVKLILSIILIMGLIITESTWVETGWAARANEPELVETDIGANLSIEFPNMMDFEDIPVTSPGDPLFIEMDDEVYEYMPAKITVHINDEWIRKNANFIEIGGSQPIYTPDGKTWGVNYSNYIPYHGEPKMEFGIRPVGLPGRSSGVTFNFIYAVTRIEEYPDTSPGSELHNFNCNRKTWPPDVDTFCGGETCTMCYRTLGSIRRDYMLLQSDSSSTLPGGFDFVDIKDVDPFYEGERTYPGFLEFTYAGEDTPSCVDRYSLRLDASFAGSQVELARLSSMYASYTETTAPGGATQGTGIEYLSDTTRGPFDGTYKLNIDYELIVDQNPPGSGGLKIGVHRQGCSSSPGATVAQEVVAAAKAFAAGYTIIPDKFIDYTPQYHLAWLPKSDATPTPSPQTGATITGLVTDSMNNPMPYLRVRAAYQEKGNWKKYETATDQYGRYSLTLPEIDLSSPVRIDMYFTMEYVRDGTHYYTVIDRSDQNNEGGLKLEFEADGPEDLVQNVKFDFGPEGPFWIVRDGVKYWGFSTLEKQKNFAAIYQHLHNTVDFYIDTLEVTLDHQLPVEVFTLSPEWSWYSPQASQIIIYTGHTPIASPKRGFVEMHEFSHHVMYDLYNRWPEGDDMPGMKNHAGYINPSTADSYIEGFAEFMPMVINDYTGIENPYIYSDFGSLELNYRTTSRKGKLEEFAIAGILWDLYDKNNDRGDTISIDLPDLWSVLSVKRKDFYEYYKAFVAAFPEKKEGIDAVFIEHGFFADTNKGNGTRDYVEPFKDANGNGEFDEGEAFVDYGSAGGLPAAMFYDEGETIGKATDYDRKDRTLEAYYPDAYLKVPDTEALLYTVSVDLADPQDGQNYEYTTGQADGLIYLMPLPDHIEATITVTPGQGYTAENIYTITNDEYSEKLYDSEGEGYFDEHEFELSGEGIEILAESEEWGFDFDGGYDSDEVIEIDRDFDDLPKPSGEGGKSPSDANDDSGGSSGSSAWIIIVVVFMVIAFGVGGFFVFRYLKNRPRDEPPAEPAKKSPKKTAKGTQSKLEVKFCRKCGQELAPESAFCRKCGAKRT